jgi:hypothetical protein
MTYIISIFYESKNCYLCHTPYGKEWRSIITNPVIYETEERANTIVVKFISEKYNPKVILLDDADIVYDKLETLFYD